MLKNLIKCRRGMALAVVLIIMVIVSVLGVVVLQISVAETRFAARDEDRMKAYYLARSGVEATTAWMLNPSNNGSSLIGKTSDAATLPDFTDGTYKVSVSTKSSTELLVKATGVVRGVSANAALILNKAGASGSSPVFDNTIYAKNILTLGGNTTIEGNVAAGVEIDTNGKSLTVSGNATCPAIIAAPPPVFPADPSTASNLTIKNSPETLDIAADTDKMMVYKDLKLQNNILTIKTGTTTSSVVSLVVDNLDLSQGTVKIEGEGTLHLFVKTFANIDCNTNYNHPLSSYSRQLIVFLGVGSYAKLDGNDKINGFFYGPGATVDIRGDDGLKGAILAGNVTTTGSTTINYDPTGGSLITYDMLPVFFYSRGNWVIE